VIFGWFDARAARALGDSLAKSFIKRVPVESAATSSDRKFEARAKTGVAAMQREVAEWRRGHTLNSYQQARAGNAFKWALKDAGYPDAYVDKLTDLFLLQLR
jgi:hypothetical protein